mmetsp:Transcript_27766/g.37134  ORF Transcript_27766/g.37134 Transcript_27766/m.37134 type:complete len:1380 (-) Transcript_27766:230-4369(-)
MFVTFITKILGHISYLSSLPPKNQLRKDILPCVVFVLQSAPVGLLRALWRKLCLRAEGKGKLECFGGIRDTVVATPLDDMDITPGTSLKTDEVHTGSYEASEETDSPSILDVFSLLNLSLKTFEYEGSESNIEEDDGDDNNDQRASWRKEFLLAIEEDGYASFSKRPRPFPGLRSSRRGESEKESSRRYTTSSSRKWHAHDGAIVIINTCRYIVREALSMLKPSVNKTSGIFMSTNLSSMSRISDSFGPSSFSSSVEDVTTNDEKGDKYSGVRNSKKSSRMKRKKPVESLNFSVADTVIFIRATSSVYLHSLSLRQSDIVIVKTLTAAVEILKAFGIKLFLSAVGETLQHWMRVVLVQCGSRRAEVRVQALEFLALILRLTWDSFGSFFRIRVPLLAVQTEVMERIVATAAARYYREQRRLGTVVQYLSNDSAEASLAPLWRTLDRLHHQSASQNVAYRSALMRIAEMMKKLYRAYIAAHALAIVNRARSSSSPSNGNKENETESNPHLQYSRVTVHRITSASAGYSKQFLGFQDDNSQRDAVTHSEAVEDAFLAAADVFSPTELPSHRVAWLRKLAEFHSSRSKFAEEATCRFYIHSTLRQAARLHNCLWNSVPFLPWASDSSDGVHLDGEGPAGEPGDYYDTDYDFEDFSAVDNVDNLEVLGSGKQIEKNNSFRRIFYRVANSVRMRTGDWDVSGNKNLFYGVTFVSEYNTVSPWITLREMEEDMVEEAETAGDLYLKAGIVESSRFAWSLATQFYSETFNYARLAYVYRRLALVVASQVPAVDTSNQLELSSPLGRFYKIWFHGGAPDELIGAEFVYRAPVSVKLEEFGKRLCEMLKSILPEKTPIDLVLDDGRPEEIVQRKNQRRPLGAVTREPIKIKVTPLRPLFRKSYRGSPEWFYQRTDLAGFSTPSAMNLSNGGNSARGSGISYTDGDDKPFSRFSASPRNRGQTNSFATSLIMPNTSFDRYGKTSDTASFGSVGLGNQELSGEIAIMGGGELIGVDKFSFTQPIKKDRLKGSRDWLKVPPGDFAEKSLRVTELQVEQCFPACVARQAVVHRSVYTQSPLEAGIEAVCSWCAVLFRTAVATNGLAVLGTHQTDQGLGTAAAKVVADCIHCSRVKEMGQALLSINGYVAEEDDGTMLMQYAKLADDEIMKYQVKLARSIVIFMELLHLLIARNRDLLLAIVQARKRRDTASFGSKGGGYISSPESADRRGNQHIRSALTDGGSSVASAGGNGSDRTDNSIAVQSELQRAFRSMAVALYPLISNIIRSETPRWLQKCGQETYFSSGAYRQTRISMGEELFFFGGGTTAQSSHEDERSSKPEPYGVPLSIIPAKSVSPNGSQCGSITSRNSDSIRLHRRPSPSRSSVANSVREF